MGGMGGWGGRLVWVSPVLVALAVYGGALPAGFVFDDVPALLENPVVNGERPLVEAWTRDFWGKPPERSIGSYRPVALLSLAIDARVFGRSPGPFHAINWIWHALVTGLVLLVGRRLVGDRAAWWAGLVVATLAAPSEAVQGIVGRADLMLGAMALIGTLGHRRPGPSGAALAATAFALALGSKESAVVLPVVWAILDLLLPVPSPRRRIGRFALYGLLFAGYLVLRSRALGGLVTHPADPLSNPLWEADVVSRTLGAARVFLTRYVLGLVDPFRRLYDCSAQACGPTDVLDGWAWAGLAVFLGFLAAPWLLRRRSPRAAAGLAWAFWVFLPASNLVILGPTIYGERLWYVPAIGLALAAGVGIEWLNDHLDRPWLARALAGTWLVLNALSVQQRNLDWRDPRSLYESGLRYAPQSAKVQYNVATVRFNEGDLVAAEAHARAAVTLWPRHPEARALLAATRDLQGHPEEAEREFAIALQETPGADAFFHAATFLARRSRIDEARSLVQRARRAFPEDRRLRDLEWRIEERLANPPASR